MFFNYSIKTLADIPETDIRTTIIQLNAGTVHYIDVIFPPGCAGFLHVRLFYQLVQIFPSNPGGSLASDAEKITWQDSLVMEHPPYQLIAKIWNDDQCYPHTIQLRFAMLAEPIPAPPPIPLRPQLSVPSAEERLRALLFPDEELPLGLSLYAESQPEEH